MYNILVADDSALMRKLMCDIINSIQNFSATDACADGGMTYKYISQKHYDAVTLNWLMPKVSGEEILSKLRRDKTKLNIIVINAAGGDDSELAAKAFDLGACDVVNRPFRMSKEQRAVFEKQIKQSLHFAVSDGKARSRVYGGYGKNVHVARPAKRTTTTARTIPVARSLQTRADDRALSSHTGSSAFRPAPDSGYRGKYSLIALASSTGGPQALHTMVPMLPKKLGVPMVIVQHMPAGFTASLAERLDLKSNVRVKEAEDGEILKPDHVYIAPGGRHLELVNNGSGKIACKVYDAPPVNNLRPCADVMYESIKKLNVDHIICTVLTGMGADGSAGIKSLKKVKDLYVITQSEDTCVVYGMPKACDQAGLSNESRPITQVAEAISKKLGV